MTKMLGDQEFPYLTQHLNTGGNKITYPLHIFFKETTHLYVAVIMSCVTAEASMNQDCI